MTTEYLLTRTPTIDMLRQTDRCEVRSARAGRPRQTWDIARGCRIAPKGSVPARSEPTFRERAEYWCPRGERNISGS